MQPFVLSRQPLRVPVQRSAHRHSLGGRQRPDSSVTAANWPPVPTSPGGQQPTPKDRAALAPGRTEAGGAARPSSDSESARWQWMRHSGRCTRTLEYTAHRPDSDRPLGPIKRRAPTAEPPLTPSPERVPRIAHAALGCQCAILVQGECSRSTGRHAREPPLVQAVVVVSSDGSTQV